MSASNASMSRNACASASGGATFSQVAPPSSVRSTVPPLPLTHATSALTAETPRRPEVVPVGRSSQAKLALGPAAERLVTRMDAAKAVASPR